MGIPATYGGGLVDGDAMRLEISVGPGAMAMLSTQASTKVYRSAGGSSSELDARVAPGALLAVLPDPVVCFAASAYRQSQRLRLDRGAGLVLVDWLSSGRRATGDRWQSTEYTSRIAVHQAALVVPTRHADGDLKTWTPAWGASTPCAHHPDGPSVRADGRECSLNRVVASDTPSALTS